MNWQSCNKNCNKIGQTVVVLILLTVITIPFCFSQETEGEQPPEILQGTQEQEDDSWLLLELGKKRFRDGEFGAAMRLFREARKQRGEFPEAEYWLGAIFEKEAELELAERQYERAYNSRHLFYIPEEQYTVLYTLAELHFKKNELKKFEDRLLHIVADDQSFSSPAQERMRQSMMDILKEDGFNKLLILYRLKTDFALNAHGLLGVYYYRTGRYGRAAEHLLFTVVSIFSTCIEELRVADPDYEFENGEECLRNILKDRRLHEYVETSELFMYIYYLAGSLYAEGNMNVFTYLMTLVSDFSPSQGWRRRAERQLASPTLEPLREY